MIKLLKNLKPMWSFILIIILLLIVQANADLELPNYTSKIVNIGIQQSGIEYAVPESIRKEQMENILFFTEDDERILQEFHLENREDGRKIYFINSPNEEKLKNLEKIMMKPIALYSLSLTYADQNFAVNNGHINEKNETTIPESMMKQLAISFIQQEYEQIEIHMAQYQNRYLWREGLQMLGVTFVSMGSAILIMLFSSKVAAQFGKNLREKVFQKVLSFSYKEMNEFSTASLITRSTNDIQQIQQLLTMLFRVIVYAPIMGIGGFIRVLQHSKSSMSWIIGLAILLILGVLIILFIVAMPVFKKLQSFIDKVNNVSREILTGLPVIRAFSREQYEEDRFEKENQRLMKANLFVNRVMSMMMPGLMFIMNGISLLIIWVGGHRVNDGIMQVGDMMAFIQYTIQIVTSFLFVSMLSIILPRASVSANRINEILEKKNAITDPAHPKDFVEQKRGWVEFKNVSFGYSNAGEKVLNNISFEAAPGKTTAIVGSTGSGKSTLVNLIPRFYDVTEGEILVDGVNVKEVKQKDLRDKIGFVPQKAILFSGTIESNIKYSNETMSDEKMEKAAEISQAKEFIDAKPDTYSSNISQGGNNVSGGQRQRLAIARAIAKDPEILIFDDSFSALDFQTDRKLRAALKEKITEKTVIIVAQRISTVLNADQILVLNEGKIVGKGTHQELLKNNEIYQQIVYSQVPEDEAELLTEH